MNITVMPRNNWGENSASGQISVTTSTGVETWSLRLSQWQNYYYYPAADGFITGKYPVEIADFAVDDDTTVEIGDTGVLSLQSSHSHCAGIGMATPHLDGSFGVYDVTVTIANCTAPYDYLNGTFTGLATTSPSTYWDYDTVARIWLSTPNGNPSPAAVTL
jgi:hypothetical protein